MAAFGWDRSYPEGPIAMNAADSTHDHEDHQARCLPHLLSLRMLAQGEVAPLPWLAADEIARATQAILAEAVAAGGEAAGREAADREAAGREAADRAALGGPGLGIFLAVRLSRLSAAADDALTAAWTGDFTQLRRHLARFDTLTSAIWTVQRAVYGPGGS
jgi:hypothetical protein